MKLHWFVKCVKSLEIDSNENQFFCCSLSLSLTHSSSLSLDSFRVFFALKHLEVESENSTDFHIKIAIPSKRHIEYETKYENDLMCVCVYQIGFQKKTTTTTHTHIMTHVSKSVKMCPYETNLSH